MSPSQSQFWICACTAGARDFFFFFCSQAPNISANPYWPNSNCFEKSPKTQSSQGFFTKKVVSPLQQIETREEGFVQNTHAPIISEQVLTCDSEVENSKNSNSN